MNNLRNIEQWLYQKHIKVNSEWLGACLEFIIDQLPSLSINELKEAVYKQWITEDLSQMGCQSLPPKINNIHRIMLTGKYILQINSLRDISQPAYGQLVKLKGGNDNADISAAPKESEPAWKTKPKRMLYLEITDGHQDLHAMEYKPIPNLSLDTVPGTKLLICGPVECRLGVLLLSLQNVQVLGGEVEALVAVNTREHVLNRVIGGRCVLNPSVANRNRNNRNNNNEQREDQNTDVPSRTLHSAGPSNATTSRQAATTQPSTSTTSRRSLSSSNFVNHRQSMGQKRLFSDDNDGFEDFEEGQDPFDNIDAETLDRLSQGDSHLTVPQIHPDVSATLDNFDFEAAELQFEEEFGNLDAFTEHPNSSLRKLKDGVPSMLQRNSNAVHVDWNTPFTYLSSLDPETFSSNKDSGKHVIIKGFLSTVTSQLRPHPTLGWQLTAKVNDGSASMDVILAHSLLLELIGFSVEQVMKIKAQCKENPQLSRTLSKSVNHCQDVLRNWTGLIELILVSPRPCLLKLLPTETKHVQLLCDRVGHTHPA